MLEENVTRVHDNNTFIGISLAVILVMVVGTVVISITIICTRRAYDAGNFTLLCHFVSFEILFLLIHTQKKKEEGSTVTVL